MNFTRSADAAVVAFSLALLPPLYFFSQLCYTDICNGFDFCIMYCYYSWLKDESLYAAVKPIVFEL